MFSNVLVVSFSFMLSCSDMASCLTCVAEIENFLSERDVSLSKESPNPGGGNYGTIEVLDNIVSFSSGNRQDTLSRLPTLSKTGGGSRRRTSHPG